MSRLIARLWLVLSCVLGSALPSTSSAMGALRHATGRAAAEVTIHANDDRPTSYFQPSELAELLAKLERALSDGTGGAVPLAPSAGEWLVPLTPRGARASDDVTRWCDVVQCRRLGGAQLLRFATPPPTRG